MTRTRYINSETPYLLGRLRWLSVRRREFLLFAGLRMALSSTARAVVAGGTQPETKHRRNMMDHGLSWGKSGN